MLSVTVKAIFSKSGTITFINNNSYHDNLNDLYYKKSTRLHILYGA
jgi:hypothetical protein